MLITINSKRLPNYSNTDRKILINIVNSHKGIIECKKTDALTWKDKDEAWKSVEVKFNASTSGPPRTSKQLKNKYESVKKELKKKFTTHKMYVAGTGGGNYIPPPDLNEEEHVLAKTIATSIHGLKNSYDSDGIAGISGLSYADADVSINTEENVEFEWVGADWTTPNTMLLQSPVNPVLQPLSSASEESSEPIEIVKNHCQSLENLDDQLRFEHNYNLENVAEDETKLPHSTKTWHNRRRPVIRKKKCMSSAASKFEALAEKKINLMELETKIAEEKLFQSRIQHEERMEILKLQREEQELKVATICIEFYLFII